eukprot:scaffold42115_cov31-Tisochrysis_lutea.AAC.2
MMMMSTRVATLTSLTPARQTTTHMTAPNPKGIDSQYRLPSPPPRGRRRVLLWVLVPLVGWVLACFPFPLPPKPASCVAPQT